MNDRELKALQHNLTRSAKKAKKYWVRGMIGFAESDQGFFPIGDIPIINTFKDKETTLDEFIEDANMEVKKLHEVNKQLESKLDIMNEKYDEVLNKLGNMNESFDSMESNYKQILEKGLAEYIKVLANL